MLWWDEIILNFAVEAEVSHTIAMTNLLCMQLLTWQVNGGN